MKEIIDSFKKNGYYKGTAVFPSDMIQRFKKEFDESFEKKRNRFEQRANHDKNRWNMLLPSDSEMIGSGFYAIPEVFNLLKNVFEKGFALTFISSDISSPGSTFQTIHQDGNDFAVAMNVPLVDSDEKNGATHIYASTHRTSSTALFDNLSNTFSDQEIIERARTLTPVSLNLKVGEYSLRDLRLIHRGTPNQTNDYRPYLSAIFTPTENDDAPDFNTITLGLQAFEKLKKKAFKSGKTELIDFANTFGRQIMLCSKSDRIKRPIPKNVSDSLSEEALYCLRFAKFEDRTHNNKINRTKESNEELLQVVEDSTKEFESLFKELE